MIFKALSFIKSHGKISAILGVTATVVTLSYQLYSHGVDVGRAEMEVEITKQLTDQRTRLLTQYQKDVQAALMTQRLDFDEELNRVRAEQVIETQTKEVIKYVEKIKEVPAQCDVIVRDIIGLLDQVTGIVITGTDTGKTESTDKH